MLTDYTVRWLEPEDYSIVESFFEEEGSPTPEPKFSRILAAFTPTQELAGFVVLQLVPHGEPVFVKPEFREQGLASRLVTEMDSYLEHLGIAGVYTQPSNPAAEALCRQLGFEKRTLPLWVKIYDPSLKSLIPE